jgi:hypothetical protein
MFIPLATRLPHPWWAAQKGQPRRKKMVNIQQLKRSIEEIDHRPTRLQRGEEVAALAASEHVVLSEQKAGLETEAQEATTITNRGNYAALVLSLIVLTAALCALDMPIQFIINRVALPTLSTLALLVLSPAVTLGLAAITHAVAHAAFFDTVRPRRTVRLCLTGAAVFGVAAAVALTILLVARTASADIVAYLVNAVSVSLWVLGESLPVTAGLVSAAAYTLSYPQIRSRRIRKLRDRLDALDRFMEWIDRDREQLKQQDQVKAKAGVAAVAAVTLLFFLLHPHRALALPQPTDTPCALFVDVTSSVDPKFRREAKRRFSETLPAFTRAFQCSTLRVGSFADEGAFAPSLEFEVPSPPAGRDCSVVSASLSGTRQMWRVFRGFNEYFQNQASTDCARSQETQEKGFREKESAFLTRVRSILDPDALTRGQCTSITPLLARLLEGRGITAAFITDGAETCEAEPSQIIVPAGSAVIFVVVPSKGGIQATGPEALRRASVWRDRVPGLKILLPDEITNTLWRAIYHGKGAGERTQ